MIKNERKVFAKPFVFTLCSEINGNFVAAVMQPFVRERGDLLVLLAFAQSLCSAADSMFLLRGESRGR